MVELWGTAPQSIMTIAQRLQNHHRLRDRSIIAFYTGNCKFLSYNRRQEAKI